MATVLLVDDDAGIRGALTKILGVLGHDVTAASNGREALAHLGAARYDVMVTDLLMPEMDGVETIIEVRKEIDDMPIIVMSGGGRTHAKHCLKMALGLGATRSVEKPVEGLTIDAMIRDLTQA